MKSTTVMTTNAFPRERSRQHGQAQQPKPAPGARKAAIKERDNGHPRHIAAELERMAIAIQSARGFTASVNARLQFIMRAIELGAVGQLNELGALIPFSWLSERTLDRVFEDGSISDAVVSQLLARTTVDGSFAAAVLAEFGENSIAGWRDAQRQGALL